MCCVIVGLSGPQRRALVDERDNSFIAYISQHLPPHLLSHPGKLVLALATVPHQSLVDRESGWGSGLLAAEVLSGVNVLSIESYPGCSSVCFSHGGGGESQCVERCHGEGGSLSSLTGAHLVGVPYPTAYHQAHPFTCGDDAATEHTLDHTCFHRCSPTPPWCRPGPSPFGGEWSEVMASFVGEVNHGITRMPLREQVTQIQQQRPSDVASILTRCAPLYLRG